jgi:putative heme-binding domain-containing protein
MDSTLSELLDSRQPGAVQAAAIRELARLKSAPAIDSILVAWPRLSPGVRRESASVLFAAPASLKQLLDAVTAKKIAANDFDPALIQLARQHRDEKIRALAATAFPPSTSGREEVLARYAEASKLTADAASGKLLFGKHCAVCHKFDGLGHDVAPDLAAIRNRGVDAIIAAVLDPNREVNPQYLTYTLRTTDGRTLTGIIAGESATTVTLRRAEGVTDMVLRADIDELRGNGVSLMPEGLEKELTQQQLADITGYLLQKQ